jgi:flavodoxin
VDVIVVYESVFGNTRLIAEGIADGAREADPGVRVTVLGVAGAAPDKVGEAALVIAGGPAHMRGMSKASTRRKAT